MKSNDIGIICRILSSILLFFGAVLIGLGAGKTQAWLIFAGIITLALSFAMLLISKRSMKD